MLTRYSGDTKGIRSQGVSAIRSGVESGTIPTVIVEVKENQRLDHIASEYYGDGTKWWIIAAASGIGWWLQVPPGTILRVPISGT